jgi:hypothetical protein
MNLRFSLVHHLLRCYLQNDPMWIKDHPFMYSKYVPSEVDDWHQVDADLARQIYAIADEIKSRSDVIVQLTKSSLLTRAGSKRLSQEALGRLPLTKKTLDEVIETPIAFNMRRLHWAAGQFLSQGIHPTRSQLTRLANVKRSLLDDPQVQSVIDEAMKIFGDSS